MILAGSKSSHDGASRSYSSYDKKCVLAFSKLFLPPLLSKPLLLSHSSLLTPSLARRSRANTSP